MITPLGRYCGGFVCIYIFVHCWPREEWHFSLDYTYTHRYNTLAFETIFLCCVEVRFPDPSYRGLNLGLAAILFKMDATFVTIVFSLHNSVFISAACCQSEYYLFIFIVILRAGLNLPRLSQKLQLLLQGLFTSILYNIRS